MSPQLPVTYERGLTHLKRAEYEEALVAFSEAIRLDPNAANAYAGRALAYRSLEDEASALRDENRVRELRAVQSPPRSSLIPPAEELEPDAAPGIFRGWHVLGRLVVADTATREQVVTALAKGIKESAGTFWDCFMPRHAVRAISSEGRVLDLVICFVCASIRVFEDRARTEIVTVTSSPERVLDTVLSTAGIQLAEKAG
jgi:tetratricopeptide (TPR) repeat protein